MNKLAYIIIALVLSTSALGSDGPIKLLSFKYFETSYSSQLGMTFFTGFIRSPMMTKVYEVDQTLAYPIPVYTWVYPVSTISYEPQFRLLELGSANSFSLNVPLAGSLSAVQTVDARGELYDPNSTEIPNVIGPNDFIERSGILGTGHAEFGALISYNLGQNATVENTWPVGLNIAAGYNFIYAPISITSGEIRSDYRDVSFWNHLVGRVGLDFGTVGIAHMFGINREEVRYKTQSSFFTQSVNTRIYHRFMLTIHIGK